MVTQIIALMAGRITIVDSLKLGKCSICVLDAIEQNYRLQSKAYRSRLACIHYMIKLGYSTRSQAGNTAPS